MSWLVFDGLVMAAGTLGVLAWASNGFGDVVARTMGMTTFALFRLFSSLETADPEESLFSGSILGNRPLLMATGLSVLTIILATEFGFLQRLLGTVSLTVDQWLICIAVSALARRGRGGAQGVEDLDRRSGGGRHRDAGGRRGSLIRPTGPASSGRGPRGRDPTSHPRARARRGAVATSWGRADRRPDREEGGHDLLGARPGAPRLVDAERQCGIRRLGRDHPGQPDERPDSASIATDRRRHP